jgi:leucyl aminopeptidase
MDCAVYVRGQLEAMGAGAILAVGQGSRAEPCMIVLRLKGKPGASGNPSLALVGKAVTFDSGGLSLKAREGMEMMKDDMAGGAAVLAAMRALAGLGTPGDVLAVIPAVENMPSGTAQRPGDVLATMDGRTVQVISTDAEGRLILADAVTYARRQGARAIVDIATLTGACRVALGEVYSGLVSNNESLAAAVQEAAAEAGERFWRLPGHPLYQEQLKSKIADLKNSGGREAGAITGGLFIGAFAGATPWAHLDIAGTCWTAKDLPDCPEGPTGVGVRTLIALASRAEGLNV